jgi:hypothetical protein
MFHFHRHSQSSRNQGSRLRFRYATSFLLFPTPSLLLRLSHLFLSPLLLLPYSLSHLHTHHTHTHITHHTLTFLRRSPCLDLSHCCHSKYSDKTKNSREVQTKWYSISKRKRRTTTRSTTTLSYRFHLLLLLGFDFRHLHSTSVLQPTSRSIGCSNGSWSGNHCSSPGSELSFLPSCCYCCSSSSSSSSFSFSTFLLTHSALGSPQCHSVLVDK